MRAYDAREPNDLTQQHPHLIKCYIYVKLSQKVDFAKFDWCISESKSVCLYEIKQRPPLYLWILRGKWARELVMKHSACNMHVTLKASFPFPP